MNHRRLQFSIDRIKTEAGSQKLLWNRFCKDYHNLFRLLCLIVLMAYGIRIVHDNFFLDSELMFQFPDYARQVWIESGRFGLVLTGRLLSLSRLIPYLSGFLMALFTWCSGILLSFCMYVWSGENPSYRLFLYLFPILYVTAPLFAEQYLFILQAAEISFAFLLCILAAFCGGIWIYRRGSLIWFCLAVCLMAWAFGSYQAMLPFYVCLVLISYVTRYIGGNSESAISQGIRHVILFLAGCILYIVLSSLTASLLGSGGNSYVSGMIRWKIDGLGCLRNIKTAVKPVLIGAPPFYLKCYLPVMLLFLVQAVLYGRTSGKGIGSFLCFLAGLGLLLLTPFMMNLIAGSVLAARSQMVYPLTAAFFLAHLTVAPPKHSRFILKTAAAILCLCISMHNLQTISQLFETSWEVYRNDVTTAILIYDDLCETANLEDMSQCPILFVGRRSAGLSGPAVRGELLGLSLFEAEAYTAAGVTGRVSMMMQILGMTVMGQDLTVMTDMYPAAVEFMRDAPSWPAQGCIRWFEDRGVYVIKLSDSPAA